MAASLIGIWLVTAAIAIAWPHTTAGRYCRNASLFPLIAIDQGVNTLAGGDPCETISSHVGRQAELGKPWALRLEKIINAIFSVFGQHDHCRSSIRMEVPE